MTQAPVAGIPSAKRDVHIQMMISIVVDGKVVYRAFNRAEAAKWIHANVPNAEPANVLESRIKNGFRNGGKVAEVIDGVRVVKTNTPAKWRDRKYHHETPAAHRLRLRLAYADSAHTVTHWRH